MKIATKMAILCALVSAPALGQTYDVTGNITLTSQGGGTTGGATEHAGQDLQVRSLTASATTGNTAVQVEPGARICLDGATQSLCFSYESALSAAVLGGNLRLPGLTLTASSGTAGITFSNASARLQFGAGAGAYLDGSTTNVRVAGGTGELELGQLRVNEVASLGTCDASSADIIKRLQSDGRLYLCHLNEWLKIYTDGDGDLASPDRALAVKTLTLQGAASTRVLDILQPGAILKLGPGTNQYIQADTSGSVIFIGSSAKLGNDQSFRADVFGSAQVTKATYWDAQHGVGMLPYALQTCDAAHKNTEQAQSDGRRYHCDGTQWAEYSRILRRSGTLDFPNLATAGSCASLTFAAANVPDASAVSCTPPTLPSTTFVAECRVSAAATVFVKLCSLAGGEDPASGTFQAIVNL